MTKKFIRIVGVSEYTRRVYVEVDGAFFIFDATNYGILPKLIPTSPETIVVDQFMGDGWEDVDQLFSNMTAMGKAAYAKCRCWNLKDPDALEHRLEISLMAADHKEPSWLERLVIFCKLRLRGITTHGRRFG